MATDLVQAGQQGEIQEAHPGRVRGIIEAMEELKAIRTFVANELSKDTDYGKIPGAGDKMVLLLPGAQKISAFFNASPGYHYERIDLGNGHLECVVTTRLISRANGMVISEGLGSCSSMEKKYRWRGSAMSCPKCGAAAIFKSKEKPEFYCWRKKDGCGAIFRLNDPSIVSQGNGQPVENPDIHDVRNTVLKMAVKRSLVAAAMSLGCLSEIFTQDIEDTYDLDEYEAPSAPVAPTSPSGKLTNDSGFGRTGVYASPEDTAIYARATREFCEDANARWADSLTGHGGFQGEVKDLIHPHRMHYHLLKWSVATKRLAPVQMTTDSQSGEPVAKASVEQVKQMVAIVYAREPEAIGAEAEAYYEKLCAEARAKMAAEDEEVYSQEGGRE